MEDKNNLNIIFTNNKTENLKNEKINNIDKILNDFWENDVWNSNYTNIYNIKIKNIIKKIQLLNKNKNVDIIKALKEENINYLKTHSDCIPEYHELIIKIKNNYKE
jgi:hypothetical protein